MNWVKLGFAVFTALAVASAQEQTALDLNVQGVEAAARRQHAEATRLFEKAIEIWRGMGSPYEPHLAITQANLAQTLSAQGKRREASELLETSLAEFRHSLGAEDLRTLIVQNLLAATLLMLGDDMRAASLLESAVAIERRLYPKDVQLARSLAAQSLLNMRAGRIQEASPLAEESMTIALEVDGDGGLDAALAYSDVAEVHRMAGRPERALPLYKKARAIYERTLGPEHPRVASVLSQEGLILMEDGKLSLAEKAMTQALALLTKSCPDCLFEHVVAETNLGLLRMRQGKYQEADRLLSHVIAVQEQNGSKPGPMMAGTLHALAQVREKERRHDDAARLQKRAELIMSFK
jgi:tetratricopeptide (TPR) repeat protein